MKTMLWEVTHSSWKNEMGFLKGMQETSIDNWGWLKPGGKKKPHVKGLGLNEENSLCQKWCVGLSMYYEKTRGPRRVRLGKPHMLCQKGMLTSQAIKPFEWDFLQRRTCDFMVLCHVAEPTRQSLHHSGEQFTFHSKYCVSLRHYIPLIFNNN